MPRVLFLTDSLSNGGAERQLALLAEYLPSNWDRRVWSMGRGPFQNVILGLGIQADIRERAWQFDITPALSLWRTINEWSPDVVHSWGWMSTLAALPICKARRIPLIDGTIRKGIRHQRNTICRWLGLSLADGVIANNRAGLKAWNIPEPKGSVIYNGFDRKRLKYYQSISNHKADSFTVGMVGRMSPDKDFNSFITAAEHIVKHTKADIDFTVLGDGNQRHMLLEKAKSLVDAGRVHFPPPTIEVIPILTHLKAGVLMSHAPLHAEGCSNAIMEYMACGLPVICSTGGGNSELVEEGRTGFLIAPGDWNALADKILYLYDHQDIADEMGEKGRKRIIANFTVDKMISRTIECYSRIIQKMPQM